MVFPQQNELKTAFENMEVNGMNKCFSKFYVSARRKDGSFYKKTSLLSVQGALDHLLKSRPHNEKFSSGRTMDLFSKANKELNSYLIL